MKHFFIYQVLNYVYMNCTSDISRAVGNMSLGNVVSGFKHET